MQTALRGARERASDADAGARHALTFSLLGEGFGVIGLLLGVITMIKKSRSLA